MYLHEYGPSRLLNGQTLLRARHNFEATRDERWAFGMHVGVCVLPLQRLQPQLYRRGRCLIGGAGESLLEGRET